MSAFLYRATWTLLDRIVSVLLANPKRPPLKYCTCGTANEPFRTSCIGCGRAF